MFLTARAEKRKFPRYQVSQFLPLVGEVLNSPQFKLISLGEGGCGFQALGKDERFKPGTNVTLSFYWQGLTLEPVLIRGRIAYNQLVLNNDDIPEYLYGVEFNEDQKDLIFNIVTKLATLAEMGQVELA